MCSFLVPLPLLYHSHQAGGMLSGLLLSFHRATRSPACEYREERPTQSSECARLYRTACIPMSRCSQERVFASPLPSAGASTHSDSDPTGVEHVEPRLGKPSSGRLETAKWD